MAKKNKKYLLIYNWVELLSKGVITKTFDTIEEVEEYINKNNIQKDRIEYLGEYKPLKYKIVLG